MFTFSLEVVLANIARKRELISFLQPLHDRVPQNYQPMHVSPIYSIGEIAGVLALILGKRQPPWAITGTAHRGGLGRASAPGSSAKR